VIALSCKPTALYYIRIFDKLWGAVANIMGYRYIGPAISPRNKDIYQTPNSQVPIFIPIINFIHKLTYKFALLSYAHYGFNR